MNEELLETKSLKRTKELLLKWKNDKNIQKIKEFYKTKSFSGILGVDRREMTHSNFLAWIFDDTQSHNLGQFAIKQLLDMLLEYGEEKIDNSLKLYNKNNSTDLQFDNLYKVMMLDIYNVENLMVGVERPLVGGRIDIIISMHIRSEKNDIKLPEKINIIIENKVDSSEHSNQTSTYYNYYKKEETYKNDLNLFVFLSPVVTSKLKDKLADNEHFININYQLISDNILERALTYDISERNKFIITEYLLSLRKPSKENKGQTMATGKLEKELLKEFWETHVELLTTAFGVLSEIAKDEGDEETFESLENMKKNTSELIRYKSIEEYLEQTKKNLSQELKQISINLINRISEVIPKAEITYAQSKINIKNPDSKTQGKVFLYITIQKEKVILNFIKDANERLKHDYPEGEMKDYKGTQNFDIELKSKDDSNFERYIELIKKEFERIN